MQELRWQDALPQYVNFQTEIEKYATSNAIDPYQFQPRVKNTLTRFLESHSFPHFLVLCSSDVAEQHALLADWLSTQKIEGAIVQASEYDEKTLFGALYANNQENEKPHKVKGLIHQAQNGILILSLTQLLEQAESWQRLKTAIMSQQLAWKAAKSNQYCPVPEPEPCQVRLILVGDREMISILEELEPNLHQLCLFAEYENDAKITQENIAQYLSVVKHFQQSYKLKPLLPSAISPLLQAGARFSEDQARFPLCPLWFRTLLTEASYQSQSDQISDSDIQQAINERHFRLGYLAERALEDIKQGQVIIDSQGEKIGQVNGLTLLSIPGHPLAYGEAARISCVTHFGDGDITDVERKSELAGNIHAKGMMIMQAFVSNALNLKEALPYCASIVFEQSYCEVDGDSASLAELCALISALSLQPIKQEIAITGSVDQFGQVQAIGGINEKIEAFYHLCEQRGLTGNQGVIFPKSNLNALCLNQNVVEAIKLNKFHLWPVTQAEEALKLLSDLPFNSENEEQESLMTKIMDRIDAFHHEHQLSSSLRSKFSDWLSKVRKG